MNEFHMVLMQVSDHHVNIESEVNHAFVGYHHEEIQYWSSLLSRIRLKQQSATQPQQRASRDFIKSRTLDFSLKSRNISLALAMAQCTGIKNGLNSLEVLFHLGAASSDGQVSDARLELEVSPMYSKLKEGGVPSSHLGDKMHHWNTLVYVGTLILKASDRSSLIQCYLI